MAILVIKMMERMVKKDLSWEGNKYVYQGNARIINMKKIFRFKSECLNLIEWIKIISLEIGGWELICEIHFIRSTNVRARVTNFRGLSQF